MLPPPSDGALPPPPPDGQATPISPPTPPQSNSPLLHTPFLRLPGYRHHKRTIASILLAVGVALIVLSLFVGWWSLTETDSTDNTIVTTSFLPGNELTASCQGKDCGGSSAVGLYTGAYTFVGQVYENVQAALVVAAIIAVAALLLGLLGAFGMTFGRWQLWIVIALTLTAALISVLAPLIVAATQPSQLLIGSGTATTTTPSPSTSFWGSCSLPTGATGPDNGICAPGQSDTWGAGLGWYMALGGAIVLLVAMFMLLTTRREPFTAAEIHAASPMAFAPASGVARTAQVAPNIVCPTCGSANPAGVASCGVCRTGLT